MIPRLQPDGRRSLRMHGPAPRRQSPRRYPSRAERIKGEPWRRDGYGSEYRLRRIAAIEATGGRCARCGRPVAVMTADGWRMRGGEVHHVRPLAEGGRDAGLMLLCVSCHRLIDAEMRRARGGDGCKW